MSTPKGITIFHQQRMLLINDKTAKKTCESPGRTGSNKRKQRKWSTGEVKDNKKKKMKNKHIEKAEKRKGRNKLKYLR